MTGDPAYIAEAERRIADAGNDFAAAVRAAGNDRQRQAVREAWAGFERWVQAVRDEFATFQAGDHQRAISAPTGPDRELRKSYEQALSNAQGLADRSIRSARGSIAAAYLRSVWILVGGLVVDALDRGAAVRAGQSAGR